MKSLFTLLTFTILALVSSVPLNADDRIDKNSTIELISEISKLQSRHLSLLSGHDGPVSIGKYKELLSTDWAKNLEVLNANLVRSLKVNSNVFDYHGLIACGRISLNSKGYRLEIYKGIVDGRVDTGDVVLGRHIIHFSDKGVITRIGKSIPLKH